MSYNLLLPVHIIQAADMSASVIGTAIAIKNQDNIGIQLNWTGSPSGTFDVQISNDHVQDPSGNITNAGNFISIPLSPAITATGTPNTAFIDVNQSGAIFIRVNYNRISGTGVLDAYISAKGV
jgi:hypothetical protein